MDATTDTTQRVVLGALLEAHPRLIGMDELAGEVPEVVDGLDFAVTQLCTDGLATRLGDRVGVTRAAERFDQLGPI